jgi:hypothetical protein
MYDYVSVRRPKKSNIAPLVISDAHRSGNPISESSNTRASAWTVDGDQEMMHEDQSSDVASSHESEALITAVIIEDSEMILDCVVELNPTTVDSRSDQAAVGVVSDLNVSKWKSNSPRKLRSTCLFLLDQTTDPFLLTNHHYQCIRATTQHTQGQVTMCRLCPIKLVATS